MKYKLSLEGQGLARSLGRWGRSSFLLINPKALWGKPLLLYASLGAEEVSASSDMNSPAQVSSHRQHRRKSRFSPTDGLSVATIPSVRYAPLPRARSDSSLTHIWERNLFATLGSAEERVQKGKQPPTQPVQINSALAEIPWPYPALLQYIFPRNKSPTAEGKYGATKGNLPTLSLSSLGTGCFDDYMLLLSTPKEDFIRRIQLHGLSKKARDGIQGYSSSSTLALLCLPAK